MKKKLVVLLTVLMVFGCVCGCGQNANDAGDLQAQEDSYDDDSEYDDDSRYVDFSEYDDGSDYDDADYDTDEDDAEDTQDDSDAGDEEEEPEVEPVDPAVYENTLLKYSVSDLDGNEHYLYEYAAGKKVILINYWATFCGPCISEMYDLGDLERKYKDQGFEIIGVTMDGYDEEGNVDEQTIRDAIDTVETAEVDYPVVIGGEDLVHDMNIQDFPTSIFVDGEGNQIGDIISATRGLDDWENMIREYLEQM